MDIDLLSKMVKELILDNDKVALPGLGCFVAEVVPSTFSDKGYTINPPYRRLSFRSKPDDGEVLVEFYAVSNGVKPDVARRIITDFVKEMKAVLHSRRMVVFPGLGRMRATKQNNVFFVADENLEIYPSGFGLQPVSLKNHEETRADVTAAVEDLVSMLDVKDDVPTGNSREEAESASGVSERQSESVSVNVGLEAGSVVAAGDLAEEIAVGQSQDVAVEDVVEELLKPGLQGTSEAEGIVVGQVDDEPAEDAIAEPAEGVVSEMSGECAVGQSQDVAVEEVVEGSPQSETQGISESELLKPETQGASEPEVLDSESPQSLQSETQGQDVANCGAQTARRKGYMKILNAVAIAVAAAFVLLLVFMLLGRVAPDFVDKLLYSAEDLEILNYNLK